MSKAQLGFYSAWAAALASIGYSLTQILQVFNALSEPLATILIYAFSLCIAPPFLLTILTLHYIVPKQRKIWTHAALLFATMYTTVVLLMYVVQLAATIPYNITDLALTVTPHSLFWTIDALGYLCMGVAAAFAIAALEKNQNTKTLRLFLSAHALMTPIIGFVYFYPTFSISLLWIASPWCITAVGSMIAFAYYFRNTTHSTRTQ